MKRVHAVDPEVLNKAKTVIIKFMKEAAARRTRRVFLCIRALLKEVEKASLAYLSSVQASAQETPSLMSLFVEVITMCKDNVPSWISASFCKMLSGLPNPYWTHLNKVKTSSEESFNDWTIGRLGLCCLVGIVFPEKRCWIKSNNDFRLVENSRRVVGCLDMVSSCVISEGLTFQASYLQSKPEFGRLDELLFRFEREFMSSSFTQAMAESLSAPTSNPDVHAQRSPCSTDPLSSSQTSQQLRQRARGGGGGGASSSSSSSSSRASAVEGIGLIGMYSHQYYAPSQAGFAAPHAPDEPRMCRRVKRLCPISTPGAGCKGRAPLPAGGKGATSFQRTKAGGEEEMTWGQWMEDPSYLQWKFSKERTSP